MQDSVCSELPPARILVVDDLYANRLAMRHALGRLAVEVVEAASGNEALSACIDQEFALILLDVQMPDMDGVEVAGLLHGEASTRDTPVIFVTAGSTDDIDRMKGYDVGAVDYIVKPLNAALLSAKVRSFLTLDNSRRRLKQALATLDQRNAQLSREIEVRRRAEARARELATHDALTGLPNRLLFLDRLETSMARARRRGGRFAIGYMDLDGFKQVNDSHGHSMGDALLQVIAQRLRTRIRASDTAARFGGDEFALIFEDIDDGGDCQGFCDELRLELAAAIDLATAGREAGLTVQVGVSLGLALYPDHGDDADRLMHNADRALYTVKRNGKSGTRIFDGDDRDPAPRLRPVDRYG